MNRNSNHQGIHDTIPQNTVLDLENEVRNNVQIENDTVMNFFNSNNLNGLMSEVVNNPNPNEPQQAQQINTQEQNPSFANLVVRSLQSSFPFFIIALVKLLHQHFFGFLVVLGFLTTQHFANNILVKQIELKDKKQVKTILLLIGYLISHILIYFQIFNENNLEKCLVFLPPNVKKMDTWNLLWIVICSDTIFKFIIICIKAIFTLFNFNICSIQTRGNFYSTVEAFGSLYRSLIPIHPWILFLFHFEDSNQSPKTLPLFLCIVYIILKLNQLYSLIIEFVKCIHEFYQGFPYGTNTVVNDSEDQICPICQDRYKNPINLKCQHVFCADCVSIWLDKENSCPMCRTKLFINKPKYRDGSTSFSIQWF
ncbi:RING finger and transmembrane domain-containing 2-like [Brachionus plicatilis]|uniref:RING finger and transmembrane domain-containing 2-like n=1 Tax=Brachionus plicatilis TaxID=10195 RepID=A0A3M7SYZ3_BRAPC|nr:RING finger and transmembrane domain-containing 2-like [Brachionus plicatilis]